MEKKEASSIWFKELRDNICNVFERIEQEKASNAKFERKNWDRVGGGGGEMSIMRGQVFEKVGVNTSTVWGEFDPKFAKDIPGTDESATFWASGISVVAHMKSPLIPAIHFNTRMIVTKKLWFGGGSDLTPSYEFVEDTKEFHERLKAACDKFDPSYYPKFKDECDKYFFLPHRNEPRGIGGIFYDYMDTGNWDTDFAFTREIGLAFLDVFPKLVRKHYSKEWTPQEKEIQLIKRGRYVEFNLIYDRGTKFGLMTNGNTEAILMSLPPECKWI